MEPTLQLWFPCETCKGARYDVDKPGSELCCKTCHGTGGDYENWPVTKVMRHLVLYVPVHGGPEGLASTFAIEDGGISVKWRD